MFRKLRNNIGAVILIVILGLVLMGATYVNLGPTSNIDGDIGVTAGHGYYINDVLLTYSDVDAEQADATLTALAGLTIGANELIYGTGADAFSMLSVNATATNKFLRQVSSGVPAWATLVAGDIPDISATYQPLDTALTNISALTYVSPSLIKLTADDTYAVRTLAETKEDLSLNYVENTKVKLDATQAPTVNNDVDEGYTAGSYWVDVTNDKAYICLDNTDGAAVWTETTGAAAGGYTDLTEFVDQTAWRIFYSNTDGDVVELALGADGTFLGSNGAAVAPTFSVPAGGGNVSKVGTPANSQVGVWTGDGTIEGAASFTYDGSNLQLTGDIGSTGTKITKGWFTDLEVANAIAGSITGNAATCTTASAGDAAVDFFGAGVDAVTDATTCTDIEGTLLSIGGTTLNAAIPADHITYDMIQDATATDKILGRSTAGAGTIEEIACTAAGRAILDDADASAQRTTLGLVIGTNVLANTVEDTTPELGGEMDAGAHTIGFTLQSTTGDGTTTIDWKLGNKFKFTFGAQNETFTFTAPTNPCTLMLTIIQDGTGSRTITWPATVKWPGGTAPTLTTTANARDKVALDWDGTQYDGQCAKDFK